MRHALKLYSDILTKLTKGRHFYDKMHINLTNQEWFVSLLSCNLEQHQ